jgi:hypothetical protein
MKYKGITLFALMLIMGVFLFPMATAAATDEDRTPPTITAVAVGDLLFIDATDDASGIDAVFINGKRINYRVDGAVELLLSDHAGTGEFISAYAVDFAGNVSETVIISNPLYDTPKMPAPEAGDSESESAVPENELRPFTPPGNGTVVDNPTGGDGKEFFTVTTPEDNVFFLIVDRQRDKDNVYLLNEVTEQDLMALATKKTTTGVSAIPTQSEPPAPTPEPEPEPKPEPPPANDGNGSLIFIIIAAAIAGGAGYYFKIMRPKQQADYDDEDYEDEADEDSSDEEYDDSDDDEPDAGLSGDDNGNDDTAGVDFKPDETFRTEE